MIPKTTWDNEGMGGNYLLFSGYIPEIQPILKELKAGEIEEAIYGVSKNVTDDTIKEICRKHNYNAQPYPEKNEFYASI